MLVVELSVGFELLQAVRKMQLAKKAGVRYLICRFIFVTVVSSLHGRHSLTANGSPSKNS
jgi:uncharacterized membrane protein YwzB